MRYIATWSMTPYINGSGTGWIRDEQLFASMVTSIRRARKWLGVKPIIYTDTFTATVLRDLTDDAEINEELEGIYENDGVPHTMWSYSKIKTLSLQTEPYVHFDLDLFFRKPLDDKLMEGDLLIQCYDVLELLERNVPESFPELYNYHTIKDLYVWNGFWDRDWNQHDGANLGILGMNNMELHNRYIEEIMGWIDVNRDALNRHPAHIPDPTFFEQQPMVVLAEEMGLDVRTVFPNSIEYPPICPSYAHFVGQYKNGDSQLFHSLRALYVDPHVTEKVIYHTKKMRSMRK